jgi:hypothetical protein
MKKTIKKALRWMLLKPTIILIIKLKYNCNFSTANFIYANWYKPFKNY